MSLAAAGKAKGDVLVLATQEALSADKALDSQCADLAKKSSAGAPVAPACLLDAVTRKDLKFDGYFVGTAGNPGAAAKMKTEAGSSRRRR